MSIIPAYLSSFSSVTPFHRVAVERQGLDQIDRNDNDRNDKTDAPEKSQKSLVVRRGDVVSNDGDVFSLSSANRSEQSAQSQQTNGDNAKELTDEEQLKVSELKQRDAEVKAHEAAHLGAAGGLARGGASYEYQKGPDDQNYAVGGEVSIDSSPVDGDPNATIAKAQQIRSAALAPARPSAQDLKVAAKASQMETEARSELAQLDKTEQESESQTTSDSQGADNKEKSQNNQKSQYTANTAVTKYVAQSQNMSLASQTTFRAIA